MNKEANKIKRKSIGDYVFLLSVPATLLLLAFIMVDIFGRFLGFSFEYSLTLEELLLMVIGIASLAATWKAGLFINIDFLVVRFSERTQKILALIRILSAPEIIHQAIPDQCLCITGEPFPRCGLICINSFIKGDQGHA